MCPSITIFYLCLIAFIILGKSQLVSITEINALKDLYSSTEGKFWTNNRNWTIGDPCKMSWWGVTCSNTSIQQLSLNGNQLNGTIPPSIGNLTSLMYLSLSSNHLLGGTIPPSIGILTSLKYLDLSRNQLSGTIPTSIWNLSSLIEIYLDYNQLSGTIPPNIGNLTFLKYMHMGENLLGGTIPPAIGYLTSLTTLFLYTNQLSGTIPPSICYLTTLKYMNMGSNKLSGTIPESIGNLNSLQFLHMDTNQLSGTIPESIGNLTSLIDFSLENNKLSGTIPPSIGNLNSLQNLYLDTNQLSGTIPPSIGNLNSLTTLYLQSNELQLCDCKYLQKLKDCNLNGITYSCNCFIPSICGVGYACNNNFTCPDIIPQPSPNVGIIPQPSSYVGIIPQPLDTSCQGNYETLFTCNNTKWTSKNTILELNGTNILNSFFDISSVFINENVLITDSYVNIKNNIFINKNSVLTLKNSNLFVDGNFNVNNESTIILDETDNFTNINIKQCAFLSGSLIVKTAYNSQIGKSLPILNYQCLNGTFSSIYFNFTDSPQCNTMPYLKYSPTSLIMYFDILDQCPSDVSWIYIILGIVGGLFLIIIIVLSFVVWRKWKRLNKKMDKLKKKCAVTD